MLPVDCIVGETYSLPRSARRAPPSSAGITLTAVACAKICELSWARARGQERSRALDLQGLSSSPSGSHRLLALGSPRLGIGVVAAIPDAPHSRSSSWLGGTARRPEWRSVNDLKLCLAMKIPQSITSTLSRRMACSHCRSRMRGPELR